VQGVPDMIPQAVANTVSAYATLSILRTWSAAWRHGTLATREFACASTCTSCITLASRWMTAACPAWLVVEARDAWTLSVQDDITVPRGQRKLARVLYELGVRH
jgi:hypothetical protein